MNQKAVGIIPARYKSSRFPGKPLVQLLGKPMVIWVAELTASVLGKENVFIATDDDTIRDVVTGHGFNVIMTSDRHLTGTDRLAEVTTKVDADIYLNIQGDEPTLDPNDILLVLNEKLNNPGFIINAMTSVSALEDPSSVNIPKVITDESSRMVYMSRSLIPGHKEEKNRPARYYKQVCIYAFTREDLQAFSHFGRKSTLEHSEDIEILRFLDLGIPVKMVEVKQTSFAVDVPGDIELVENRLREIHGL